MEENRDLNALLRFQLELLCLFAAIHPNTPAPLQEAKKLEELVALVPDRQSVRSN